MLGGIRNHLAVYAARAVVLRKINPNEVVQVYAPNAAAFGDEYLWHLTWRSSGDVSALRH